MKWQFCYSMRYFTYYTGIPQPSHDGAWCQSVESGCTELILCGCPLVIGTIIFHYFLFLLSLSLTVRSFYVFLSAKCELLLPERKCFASSISTSKHIFVLFYMSRATPRRTILFSSTCAYVVKSESCLLQPSIENKPFRSK